MLTHTHVFKRQRLDLTVTPQFTVCLKIHTVFIYPKCLLRTERNTRLIILADFNTKFSFCKTSFCNMDKEYRLLNYLLMAGDSSGRNGFMPFQRIFAGSEIHTTLSRIWTLLVRSTFDNENYYFFFVHLPLLRYRRCSYRSGGDQCDSPKK